MLALSSSNGLALSLPNGLALSLPNGLALSSPNGLALSLPNGLALSSPNGVKLDKEKVKNWLLKNKIQPTQRAETLSIRDWVKLTKSFKK